jgi:hypothetical protein
LPQTQIRRSLLILVLVGLLDFVVLGFRGRFSCCYAKADLDGSATHAHAVSFVVINIPQWTAQDVVATEACLRRRTDIGDRIREARFGAPRRMPSGTPSVTPCGCGPRCSPATTQES